MRGNLSDLVFVPLLLSLLTYYEKKGVFGVCPIEWKPQ